MRTERFIRMLVIAAMLGLGVGACTVPAPAPATKAPQSPAAETAPTTAPAATEKVKLVFVHYDVGENIETWNEVLDGFRKENPNIDVELRFIALTGWNGYVNSIVTQLASGEQIDVARCAIEINQVLASKNLIIPLDDYLARDKDELKSFNEQVAPALFDAFKYQGHQWMLPNTWNNMVIWYNKERLAEVGLEAPKANWTKDDFLTYAQKLTKDVDGDGQNDLYGSVDPGVWFTGHAWLFANDTDFLNDTWDTATANG